MAPEAKRAVPSAAANGKNGHTLISDTKFRQLYALAVKLHLMAEGGDASAGKHEAALAGVVADLRDDDVLIARRQTQIAALLHGGVPKTRGGDAGETGTNANERIIEAVSQSLADRMRKSGRVTVIYLPGAEGAGVLEEAKQLAERARLPVLFVEEAPDWLKPARRSPSGGAAESAWMPAIPVDADDVVAMYRVAHESIARARQGGGPTRILCVTEPAAARSEGQPRSANAAASLEHWLEARGLPAQEWRQEIAVELGQEGASRQRPRATGIEDL
jgi:Dehydrogenase E1 component